MGLDELIEHALRTPIGTEPKQPTYGFQGLEKDGSAKTGLAVRAFEDMARACLVRCVPGVAFIDIAASCDQAGKLQRISVDYVDEIHDPSQQRVAIRFADAGRA